MKLSNKELEVIKNLLDLSKIDHQLIFAKIVITQDENEKLVKIEQEFNNTEDTY